MRRPLTLLALALHSCSPPPHRPPEIELANAWAREPLPGKAATAAYVTIINRGGSDDALVSVAASAGSAQLHSTSMNGGIMRMRKVERLPVVAGSAVTLDPGGTHIMLTGLTGPLLAGGKIELVFNFEKSRQQTVAAQVRESAGGSM